MAAKWIPNSFFDGTANLLAFMFLTRLEYPTDFLALVILNVLNLIWSHHLQFEMLRIVKLVARN